MLIIEIQALVVSSGFGMAKRNFVGVNINRANLISATLEKIVSIPFCDTPYKTKQLKRNGNGLPFSSSKRMKESHVSHVPNAREKIVM